MKRFLLLFALVACSDPPTATQLPPDGVTPPVVELLPLQLVFDYSCRFHGLNPRHTFRADVDPDTLEIAYELVVNDRVQPFRDAVGTFTDTLYVDWGDVREVRVNFVFSYEDWRVEGVTRCRVQ